MRALNSGLAAALVGLCFVGSSPAEAGAVAASTCSPRVRLLARGYGSPDDIAVQGHRLVFGDLARNVLAAESGGRVTTLATGLSVPEGIVVQSAHRVVVVEQGANRIDAINLATGRRTILRTFVNRTGLEGIDGIGAAPNGGIYVPDSPYGTLYLLDRQNRLHFLAGGLQRPVDAIRYSGGIAVADENANAVWLVRHGHPQRLATIGIPDDLAVFHGSLLTDSLSNGGLWEARPRVKLLVGGFGQPQGLTVLNSGTVVVTNSTDNGIYSVSGLHACL